MIDVAATVLEVAGLPEPTSVHGVQQQPLHGVSMAYSFDDADAAEQRETQYFERQRTAASTTRAGRR